ncbi:glycosyl transferase [Ensifer sp. LC13]|nr:glycosyl transferase [Ensifer sp. LC11]OCO99465.1 glycosyl transferase [Ensifer sp. LC13]OCP12972.1 glycosyl transferase [Ensifer sp. LC14]OCP29696.1 glycosyl transferase [Ensifer sp. LC499]
MLGLRGIPNVQGGVEKHVEMLASKLLGNGWDVEVIGRRRYLEGGDRYAWNGVEVVPLWAPRRMALEAIVHTFLGVCLAAWRRPDVLHIHAIGPALMTPLARMLGLKVVVTHHGYDYDRQKWGGFARRTLKLGEFLGMRFSNGRVAISRDIAQTMRARHHVSMTLVPNGVAITPPSGNAGTLAEFGLVRRRYILLAARIVPEKRQLDLIRAFAKCGLADTRLVLAGGAEFDSAYVAEVKALAREVPGVVLTDFQSGDRLAELFANAALFVLPSSHEGMPIALLEAMAYGLPVLASDIVANRELDLAPDEYFHLGDVDALAAGITKKLAAPLSDEEMRERAAHAEATYSWTNVAQKTAAVYSALLAK